MSEENWQEPDMSDKELKAANEYAIKHCLSKYDDTLDFVTHHLAGIDRKIVDDMASLIISEAIGDDRFAIAQLRTSTVMFEKLGKEVKHTHGI